MNKCLVSLQVMSVKALGIAIKLTLEGSSQVAHLKSWVFAMVAATCVITQLNYLNKVGTSLPKTSGISSSSFFIYKDIIFVACSIIL